MQVRLPTITLALVLATVGASFAAAAGAVPGPASRTVHVDCAAGDTIAHALALPADELVIELSGTCVEDLVIERDRVIVRGVTPDATIQGDLTSPGSAVLIRGASKIDLQSLAITGGETVGVRIQRNAEATLRGVRLTETPFFGLLIEQGSSAVLIETIVSDHGFFGVVVFGDSGITVQGTNDLSRNGQIGLFMSSGATIHTNGVSQITANDNGTVGIFLQAGAGGLFGGVEARRNGFAGLDMAFGGHFASIGVNEFSDNGVFGVTLGHSARFSAAGTVVNNGSVGVFASENARVEMVTDIPTRVAGSPVDVILEGAVGTFGSSDPLAADVVIEGTMELTFGSRVTFSETASIGTLTCDGTVLTQGSISCPAPMNLDLSREALGGAQGSAARRELPRSQMPILPPLD